MYLTWYVATPTSICISFYTTTTTTGYLIPKLALIALNRGSGEARFSGSGLPRLTLFYYIDFRRYIQRLHKR